MSQDEVVRQAKEGNPQAIATLIGKSLTAKGMAVKATNNNGCLVVQVEAQTVPPQQGVVNFVKTGLLNLKPNNISQAIIQGRVTGQPEAAWQESFNLGTPEIKPLTSKHKVEVSKPLTTAQKTSTNRISTNHAKTNSFTVERLTELVKTRNGERATLILGTVVLTSICWLGVGALSPRSNITSTESTKVASSTTGPSDTSSFSLKGKFQLVDSKIGGTASNCYGTGGYDDVEAGMPVTIRDGNGSILATGKVGDGTQPSDSQYSSVTCVFEFQVDNVPKADFYAIEVGRRGQLNYSFAEMQEKNWSVQLSLGT